MTHEHKKGFIEELQSLEEPTKLKVLIISALCVMVIVVYMWLGYFNNLVSSNAPSAVADSQTPTQTSAPTGTSFVGSMQNELASIYEGFIGLFRGIGGIFKGPGQYNIKPQ
jgi:hypothetical protein